MDIEEVKDVECLRRCTQDLLDLLKQKQSMVKGACNRPVVSRPVLSTTAPLIDNRKSDVLGISQPIRSSDNARQRLSQLTQSNGFQDTNYDKYSSYRPTTSQSRIGGRKPVAQGIENSDDYETVGRSNGYYNGDSYHRENNTEMFDTDLEQDLERVRSLLAEGRASLESDHTKSSTPFQTPTLTPQGTPKSILKRRKMIDDNVAVTSKYPHTPVGHLTPKHGGVKGLNYSYSDADEEDLTRRLQEENNTSFTEQTPSQDSIPYQPATKEAKKRHEKLNKQVSEIESLLQNNLLQDCGNDRQNVSIVRDLSQRPKAVLFDMETPGAELSQPSEQPDTSTDNQSSQSLRNSTLDSNHSSRAAWQQSKQQKTLMGYDWIAGLLDNEGSLINQPDDFFKELNEFRRVNKMDCIGKESALTCNRSLPAPISPVVRDPKHTCIHGYTVSDRLFTQPMNVDEDGTSVCPICLIDRKPPTQVSPGFVRVSVPRSTVASPYRVIPHRRRSFDPSDSCALSNHCLQGWQNAKPSSIPTASTVDIKQGIKEKQILSYEDVQIMADSISKMGRLMQHDNSSILDATNSTNSFSSQRQGTKATKDLLNTSHSLRAELQQLEKHRGLDRLAPPCSTNYPLF